MVGTLYEFPIGDSAYLSGTMLVPGSVWFSRQDGVIVIGSSLDLSKIPGQLYVIEVASSILI